MQTFNIVKSSEVEATYRVARVKADYDFSREIITVNFSGTIECSEEWTIGAIVGNSGTGKSTIARELYADNLVNEFEYTHKSVIDDMPEQCSFDEVARMFYAVGFGSVPSWVKPHNVLSTGERMRVDLARALLSSDFVVFDEFTSVVDRNVAKNICVSVRKCCERLNKRFIAVSCHRDIIEWLQPDWAFDTDVMRPFPSSQKGQNGASKYERATIPDGKSIATITI